MSDSATPDAETQSETEYMKARAQNNTATLKPVGERHTTTQCKELGNAAFIVELDSADLELFEKCEVCH